MKNVILKSFDNFIAQPLGILRSKIIRIANLKSDFATVQSINVEILDESIQVNITNNDKVYNLLSAVVYKKRMQELRGVTKKYEHKTSRVFGQLTKS